MKGNAQRLASPKKKNRILTVPCMRKRVSLSFDRLTSDTVSSSGHKYGLVLIDNITKRAWTWLLKTKTEQEFINTVIDGKNPRRVSILSIIQGAHSDLRELHIDLHDPPHTDDWYLTPAPQTGDDSTYHPTHVGSPTTPQQGDIASQDTRLHTDNEGTFFTTLVSRALSLYGATVTRTAPYTPAQNGIVERLQGTLAAMTRAAIFHANIPKELWSDVFMMQVVHYNCCLHSSHRDLMRQAEDNPTNKIPPILLQGKSPLELDTGVKPRWERLWAPYTPGFAWTHQAPKDQPYNQKRKWDPRGRQAVVVGYLNPNMGIPAKVYVRFTDGLPLRELLDNPASDFHKIHECGHFNPDRSFSIAGETSIAQSSTILPQNKQKLQLVLSVLPKDLLDHEPSHTDTIVDASKSNPSPPNIT
ncbi:hypothetical protein TrRE_jg5026, partial [Triparma retinervis]